MVKMDATESISFIVQYRTVLSATVLEGQFSHFNDIIRVLVRMNTMQNSTLLDLVPNPTLFQWLNLYLHCYIVQYRSCCEG